MTNSLLSRPGQKGRAFWEALGTSDELIRSAMGHLSRSGISGTACLALSGISNIQTALTLLRLLELPGTLSGTSTPEGSGNRVTSKCQHNGGRGRGISSPSHPVFLVPLGLLHTGALAVGRVLCMVLGLKSIPR